MKAMGGKAMGRDLDLRDTLERGMWALCMLLVCGCATKTPPPIEGTQYGDAGEVDSGSPASMTMYDLDSASKSLLGKMLGSRRYAKEYNAAKVAKGGVPLLVIGGIESRVEGVRLQDRLDVVGETIRTALYDSEMFNVKDDNASAAILNRIVRGADGGLEDGILVKATGTQESPDFIVLGDLKSFADIGGRITYRLHMALHSLKTGKILWEGAQTMVKL